jgi:hypothetical protein
MMWPTDSRNWLSFDRNKYSYQIYDGPLNEAGVVVTKNKRAILTLSCKGNNEGIFGPRFHAKMLEIGVLRDEM